MDNSILIIALALVTLLIVVGVLVYQRFSVKKAQDEHHHSAMTRGHPEQRD
jgi:flagellar basal body-associated protein FliL